MLVGRDLIKAAEARAQITQIEKYNSAVNTFRGKFNALPGDMSLADAKQYGFTVTSCTGTAARRDGNGMIDAYDTASENSSSNLSYDEPVLFWSDLGMSNLIEGTFTLGNCSGFYPSLTQTSLLMPTAKINSSAYVYVYDYNQLNYFGISTISAWSFTYVKSVPAFTVAQAYAIDKKTDDGIPTTGHTVANFVSGASTCPQTIFTYDTCTSANTTTSGGTASSCFDTTTGNYSVTVNNGTGLNCNLSFQFQ